jgi:hypothetical protein
MAHGRSCHTSGWTFFDHVYLWVTIACLMPFIFIDLHLPLRSRQRTLNGPEARGFGGRPLQFQSARNTEDRH